MKRLAPFFLLLGLLPLNAAAQLPSATDDAAGDDNPAVDEVEPRYEREFDIEKEDPDNPLVLIDTNRGEIVLELFPGEAPRTVDNFIGLAEGHKSFVDPDTDEEVQRPFYDGLVFHRVVEDFMIQGGSPTGRGDGHPGYRIEDEINAESLGLDRIPVIDEDGYPHSSLGVDTQKDFQRRILGPLYEAMGIEDQEALEERSDEVFARVQEMTLMEAYELQGYDYLTDVQSRAPVRGIIAMANSGPDTAGSQFFITLEDTPWLSGKFTVFGKVRQGMDIVDAIGDVSTDDNDRPRERIVIDSIRALRPET